MTSKMRPLPRAFYLRKTVVVARALLGQILVVQGEKPKYCRIVETEAYLGVKDPSAHSFGNRKSVRTASMYLVGGHSYVYFIYGMYFCFNVSTGRAGDPEAVLIRAVEIETEEGLKLDVRAGAGPGKLCRELKIDKSFDGIDLTSKNSRIWIAKGISPKRSDIVVGPRIGLSHEEAKHWPLRFYLASSASVSKPLKLKKTRLSSAR